MLSAIGDGVVDRVLELRPHCRRLNLSNNVISSIDHALVSSGLMCSTIRTDTDDKICLGHVLHFTRAESDALPVEAGGSASRQDMPLLNRETAELMRRHPATLDDVRTVIFPSSSLEASGDPSPSPDASGPDLAEVAAAHGWESSVDRSVALMRAGYSHIPLGSPLWAGRGDVRVEPLDPIRRLLASQT